jgi:hypothetical protein
MSLKRSFATVQKPLSSVITLQRTRLSIYAPSRVSQSAVLLSNRLGNPYIRSFSTTKPTNEKMRCILIKDGQGPVENLYLGEEETPEPKQGEVLVKIKVISQSLLELLLTVDVWFEQDGPVTAGRQVPSTSPS